MYINNNTIYADAFKVLVFSKPLPQIPSEENPDELIDGGVETAYGYTFPADKEQYVSEVDVDMTSITCGDKYAYLNGGKIAQPLLGRDKKSLKTDIISKRYDSDDQMAIVLNQNASEAAALKYQKMQEWRDFADKLSIGILNKLNGQ